MKTLFKSILFLLLLPAICAAHENEDQKHVKQKTIKKAYIVNPDAGIDIQNSYGSVYVTTWAEDKIEIEVLIKVSSDSDSWAAKKLDDITVDIEALKSLVTAKTIFSNGTGNSNSKNNSIEVNYTIKIPSSGSAKVFNKYGNIITTDLVGAANIKCKYGKITLAKLNSNNNVIDIEYCGKSSIVFAKSATISADYSGLSVNDFGNITLKSDYSDVNLNSGNNLKYNSSYGKILIGVLKNLEGNGNYITVKIDEISGNLKIDTEYSQLGIGKMSAKAGNVYINSGYTNVDLGYDAQYPFDFDVSVKYANFKNPGDLEISSKQETQTSKSYEGYYKKSGSNKVTIVSEFGNVNFSKK